MASPQQSARGESGRNRTGKHSLPPSTAASFDSARRGRSPARGGERPGNEDTSSTTQQPSKARRPSPSPRQRLSENSDKPHRPRGRSPSIASQRSDTYRRRELVGRSDSRSARKLPSDSNRHRRDSPPLRKRRRTRTPSPPPPPNRHKDLRRDRSPVRARRADTPPRDIRRDYNSRRVSRSRSPPRSPRAVQLSKPRPARRPSPSPPPRASDSYVPPRGRRRTPSPNYTDTRASRRRSPSPPRRRSRDTYYRRSPSPSRPYKDTERRDTGRAERRHSKDRAKLSRRSPSIEPRPRGRSPSPDSQKPQARDPGSNTNRARPQRDHNTPPSPRSHREAKDAATRKRSRSISPQKASRRESRDREMYPRQQHPYGQPPGRPPPIDTRFGSSPQHGYPPHRGGYGGPSPNSYHSSPNWSPQQSAYYPPQGSPQAYPQQGGYPPQNSYPQQNYGPLQQSPPSAPHSASPPRGGRGGFRGGLINGTSSRPQQPPPAQTPNFPPATNQRGGGAHFSNLTWKPGVGVRGGNAPTHRLTHPPSSSAQASQAPSTASRDNGASDTIDEDADDNPFRPAKELRAKEHKPADNPVKSNKDGTEDQKISTDDSEAAKPEHARRSSEPGPVHKAPLEPPSAPASHTPQGPKIGPFKLVKGSTGSKAAAAAAKPNLFQAKAPPAQPAADRRPPVEPSRPEPLRDAPPLSRFDDRRPHERRSDPYMRDSYDRDGRYHSRDPRDQYDRRDYRGDSRYPRHERDRPPPPPRDAREMDRVEPSRRNMGPPPKPDVKVLVVREVQQVWKEREGWKMFPRPTDFDDWGHPRWGKKMEFMKPPRYAKAICPPEHQIPPKSVLPAELNEGGKSVYPRKGGGASVVGTGTYGQVYKSINVYKHEQGHVALKKLNMQSEKNGFPFTAVREIRTLIPIRNDKVPRLVECMVEANAPYMVFEYVPFDLAGLINHGTFKLTAGHRKDLAKQMYEGIMWLHTQGILHRDIKAANILVDKKGGLKLTDFGLCKTFDIKKGAKQNHTNRVVTIWYRAPELLLGAYHYGTEIDFWAAACVLVEILNGGNPIFPGPGSDIMQLDAMFWCLGKPTKEQWPDLENMPWWKFMLADENIGGFLRATENSKYKRRFEDRYGKKLTPMALDLLQKAFRWDPDQRPDGEAVLKHPYFTEEEPAPARCIELENLDGDFHEWDHKLKRKAQREEKEKREKAKAEKAERDKKRAAEDGGEGLQAKRPRTSGSNAGGEEVKSDGEMAVDVPSAQAEPASAGMDLDEKPSA